MRRVYLHVWIGCEIFPVNFSMGLFWQASEVGELEASCCDFMRAASSRTGASRTSMLLFFACGYIPEGMDIQYETCISACMDRL